MTVLVDLFPAAPAHMAKQLEQACEHIEATAGQPFSLPSLTNAICSHYAATNAVRSMLAVGLVERLSPPNARPVLYRVPARHLPRGTS